MVIKCSSDAPEGFLSVCVSGVVSVAVCKVIFVSNQNTVELEVVLCCR